MAEKLRKFPNRCRKVFTFSRCWSADFTPDSFSRIGCYFEKVFFFFFFVSNTFHMSPVSCLDASFCFTISALRFALSVKFGSARILRDHIPSLGFSGNAKSVLPLG